MMKEYKKSYSGFIIWMILFIAFNLSVGFLPIDNPNISLLITLNVIIIMLNLLVLMIYNTEYIYWYTGLTYEEAAQATSEQRKRYAGRHLTRFTALTIIYIIYTVFSILFSFNMIVNILVSLIGIVLAVISALRIKLED